MQMTASTSSGYLALTRQSPSMGVVVRPDLEKRRAAAWSSQDDFVELEVSYHSAMPPKTLPMDLMFFRTLFERLRQNTGAPKDKGVHVTYVSNAFTSLLDAVGLDGLSEQETGIVWAAHGPWITWRDMAKSLMEKGFPKVKLTVSERIFLTLDDPASSDLARLVSIISSLIIVGNLTLIVVQTLPNYCEMISHRISCSRMEFFFCLFFTSEYLLKLVSVAGTRLDVIDRDKLLTWAVPAPHAQHAFEGRSNRSPILRMGLFVMKGMNMIDLISVLPFWSKIVFGTLLPPSSASFLRALRITRIFRILKTGKYLQTLQALGNTLVRSFGAVVVLMLYILITSLIAGVVLQQVETGNDGFDTVPQAGWWAFVRLIGAQHSAAYAKGRPESLVGTIVLSSIMCYKGILWILPFGQIGSIFRETWAEVDKVQALKDELEAEQAAIKFKEWYEPGSSMTAHLEVWPCPAATADQEAMLSGTGGSKNSEYYGLASLPVPILNTNELTTNKPFQVVISRGNLHPVYHSSPVLHMEFRWNPSPEMKKKSSPALPQGTLTLRCSSGENFPSKFGDRCRWLCRLSVPTSAHHYIHPVELMSTTGGTSPTWSDWATFEIDWSDAGPETRRKSKTVSQEDRNTGMVTPAVVQAGDDFVPSGDFEPTEQLDRRVSLLAEAEQDFERRALHLLEKQAEQLDHQNKLIQDQQRRLARLEEALLDEKLRHRG